MKSRVLVLGAGFGGLELSTVLSEALGEEAGVTVIEKSDAFVFGYSRKRSPPSIPWRGA